MTPEQIRKLISDNLQGQGTNLDASGMLSSILNSIIDLIHDNSGESGVYLLEYDTQLPIQQATYNSLLNAVEKGHVIVLRRGNDGSTTLINSYFVNGNAIELTYNYVGYNTVTRSYKCYNHTIIIESGKEPSARTESLPDFIKNGFGAQTLLNNGEYNYIPVTKGDIDAYKMLFDASYNNETNKFNITVGATVVNLTPGEMIIVNEEYNKPSNDADFTAMWAYSISKYICCAPWFEGFVGFKLHSAFYKAESVIMIDLNSVELPVVDLTNAFFGCSRLEQISGIISIQSNTPIMNAFKGCEVLHTFRLHGLNSNIDLSDCRQLTFETFEDLIENAGNGNFTIKVHPDVKAKIETNPDWDVVRNMFEVHDNITLQ